ncbi:MAG: hypothetical protein ACRDVG_05775 [Jatrophihabitantaceae bacterium]
MFQPVGDLPPSIYWRRRFALVASVIALLVLVTLTVHVLASGNDTKSGAAGPSGTPSGSGGGTSASTARSTPASSASSTRPGSSTPGSTSPGASGSSSGSVPPQPCAAEHLDLSAAVEHPSYSVGASPVVSILIKNLSAAPCVQDLADKQIVLSVYNGESRVWGSHDCKTQPGTDERTLNARASVRISIVWSGLSSQPGCQRRQRVGAGTYTLYASLAGRQGRAAQFTIR